MTPHPWYAKIVELVVTSLCVIGVLLLAAMATHGILCVLFGVAMVLGE